MNRDFVTFVSRTCPVCGEAFILPCGWKEYAYKRIDKRGKVRLFCRYNCMREFDRSLERKNRKTCAICGKVFISPWAAAAYCSDGCRKEGASRGRKASYLRQTYGLSPEAERD